jgi:Lipoprotein LpqB beta-propeller domain/Sporulation and spore germination
VVPVIRRWRRPLAVVLLAGSLTGCSLVPTSTATVQITQVPAQPDVQVGIEPQAPEEGATPEEIVRGFIDAAASPARGHPVAKEYLTPEAADAWADDTGLTVIAPEYSTVATSDGRVRVTATEIGTVDERGSFTVVGRPLTRDYSLAEVDGEWRITAPPDGLTILLPDFERLYDEVAVYFLDPTSTRLVPDPRYLIEGDARPTVLVDQLIAGPSTLLNAGVSNPMRGVGLRRAVTVDGTAATVDLTGLPADPAAVLPALSAQLVHSLAQVGLRTVTVLVDGERVSVPGAPAAQTVDDWAAFSPDAVPIDSVGHFLAGGAVRTLGDGEDAGEPIPGPAGEGVYDLVSAIASADPEGNGRLSFLVGVGEAAGGAADRFRLLAGPYDGELVEVTTSDSFTPPTVAATRNEAWTVRGGSQILRVPSGAEPAPQLVEADTLSALGRTTALKLSPDGVRAALVVDGTLRRGLVVRTDDGVALRDLQVVHPDLSGVVDVAWQDSGHLVVLAEDDSDDRVVPWEVGIDGWGLQELPVSGLPDEPTAIAMAPTKRMLVSVREERTIWQLSGGTWQTIVAGEPPLNGVQPFYPL